MNSLKMNSTKETKGKVIKVKAILLPFYLPLDYNGPYTPVASFEGLINLAQFSSEDFVELLTGQTVEVAGVKCRFVHHLDTYDKTTNTITLRAGANSLDDQYVAILDAAGWIFDEATLRRQKWRGLAHV